MKLSWEPTVKERDKMAEGISFVDIDKNTGKTAYNLGNTKEEGAEVCRAILKAVRE